MRPFPARKFLPVKRLVVEAHGQERRQPFEESRAIVLTPADACSPPSRACRPQGGRHRRARWARRPTWNRLLASWFGERKDAARPVILEAAAERHHRPPRPARANGVARETLDRARPSNSKPSGRVRSIHSPATAGRRHIMAALRRFRSSVGAQDLVARRVALDDEPVARRRVAPPLAFHARHAAAVEDVGGPLCIAARGRIGHGRALRRH